MCAQVDTRISEERSIKEDRAKRAEHLAFQYGSSTSLNCPHGKQRLGRAQPPARSPQETAAVGQNVVKATNSAMSSKLCSRRKSYDTRPLHMLVGARAFHASSCNPCQTVACCLLPSIQIKRRYSKLQQVAKVNET